jgi:hypothetical protein
MNGVSFFIFGEMQSIGLEVIALFFFYRFHLEKVAICFEDDRFAVCYFLINGLVFSIAGFADGWPLIEIPPVLSCGEPIFENIIDIEKLLLVLHA